MLKPSPLAVVMQQLKGLSLAELLEVQARVDALIKSKSLGQKPFSTLVIGSDHTGTKIQLVQQSQYQVEQIFELKTDEDDSLEKVINLVDEWMNDESAYDEETYPQIEAALNQNRLSI